MVELALAVPDYSPRPGDPALADKRIEQWLDAAAKSAADAPDAEPINQFAQAVTSDRNGRAILSAVFGNSSFLTYALLHDVRFARSLFTHGPDASFSVILTDLRAELSLESAREVLTRALRIARRRAALTIALADLTGAWPLERITDALSQLAETALSLAVRFLLRRSAERGKLVVADPADPERDSGLIILGMGKLGARELNFSSDIDLVVLFDPRPHLDRQGGRDASDVQTEFTRLARELVNLLSERTPDGYVFRTDLRLRPDPSSTPLAMHVEAAETYYGSMGQNWERAAMIKARPVAGDLQAGREFLNRIRPFVWRKSLDFAAIRDIHAMKRQINAYRGIGEIGIEGQNVKLGPGGIREIEFFAQTLQLIWGGRIPALRVRPTCDALRALSQHALIDQATTDSLIDSYHYLRSVEHRLQMIDDQQTHSLPDTADGVARLAAFMGEPDEATFRTKLRGHLESVSAHYSQLFADAPSLSAEGETTGNLVFTGTADDPETLATLAAMGFSDPVSLCNVVRSWHHGRVRATRSERARELLTALMPTLLQHLSETANPDAAFNNFAKFLDNLPSGVQLFSMIRANPELLEILAEIMGSAPDLGARLGQQPILLDCVLEGGFFGGLPSRERVVDELGAALAQARDFEDMLDAARRFTNDRRFQIGVQLMRGLATAEQAGPVLSDIADGVIGALLSGVTEAFVAQHGTFDGPETGMCVVALGKLGARELTARSDLDLVFIYAIGDRTASNGPKPLPPSVYFARLGQRLISALTVLTGEGPLFEIDMRLRPSGNSGPLAVTLDGFRDYQRKEAWTWERMALTRARVVAGPPVLARRITEAIHQALRQPSDAEKICADVLEMRARLDRDKPASGPWDVKSRPGGMLDVDFIAQGLALMHCAARPEVLVGSTGAALARLSAAGVLGDADCETLIAANRLWQSLQALLRITVGNPAQAAEIPAGLRPILARAAGADDFAALEGLIEETARKVESVFRRALGPVPGRPEPSG